MHYSQYKTAAEKHLQTCEYMIANLSYERLNKLKVLRNVYYLCGYALEGLVNFWIFELLKRDGQLYNENNVYENGNYPISIGSGKVLVFYKNSSCNTLTHFWFSQHNFKRNVEVFNHLADGNSLSIVPIVMDRTDEPYPRMFALFDSWDVKVRYQNHPSIFPYNQNGSNLSTTSGFQTTFETDIVNFVSTTRLIYDVLEDIQLGRNPRI